MWILLGFLEAEAINLNNKWKLIRVQYFNNWWISNKVLEKLYIISKSKEEAFGTVAPLHNKSPFELVCLEEDQGKSLMIFNTQQSPQGQKDAFLSLKGSWEASFSVDNHLSPMNSKKEHCSLQGLRTRRSTQSIVSLCFDICQLRWSSLLFSE